MSIPEVCAFISSGVIIIVPPKSKRFENEANVTLLSLYPVNCTQALDNSMFRNIAAELRNAGQELLLLISGDVSNVLHVGVRWEAGWESGWGWMGWRTEFAWGLGRRWMHRWGVGEVLYRGL